MPDSVRYTIALTLTVPVENQEAVAAYTSQAAKTGVERNVLMALRKLDGDADCEVMDAEAVQP
jgi:hypothetical protein